MGDPKKTKKHYVSPRKPWDKVRLDDERGKVGTYGLKNKRELWRVETILRGKRENARKLLALPLEERLKREKQLVDSLARMGLLGEKSSLDDVLSLGVESLLERRLQTLVWRKGLANTVIQARQFITHGHIAVDGRKVTSPSYIVPAGLEENISYYGKEMEIRQPESKKAVKPRGGKSKLAEEFEEAMPSEEKGEEEIVAGEAEEEKAAEEEGEK